jgi:class 3 adenylate cyclase
MKENMPRLRYKSFTTPDEVRPMPKGRAAIVSLDEVTVGRSEFNPGWRWSTDLAPMMGTKSCQVHHLGHAVSGLMHVHMDDGEELDIPPDSIYEIPPGHDAWVVGNEPWVTVEWTSARIVGIGPEGPGERVLATVLFTDIVGSTAMLERMGDRAWQGLLRLHNVHLRNDLNTFRGREVKTTGDGFLAVFDGATKAVRCAAAMTRSAHELGLAIRVGIHTGEVEFVGSDVRGVAVHAAARVMSLAGPDEVFVTSTTSELLDGSDVVLEEAGTHELKGLSGRRQVFRLVMPPRDDVPV